MSTNFKSRHIGPRSEQTKKMLEELGFDNLEEMSDSVIPKDILCWVNDIWSSDAVQIKRVNIEPVSNSLEQLTDRTRIGTC